MEAVDVINLIYDIKLLIYFFQVEKEFKRFFFPPIHNIKPLTLNMLWSKSLFLSNCICFKVIDLLY